ncbi:MAG: aminopeptidase P family protein [Chloroflexi bacterium]|nr:aminopeptidase P family protein [Chloroflexota bacterium]
MNARLSALRQKMAEQKLDAMLVTQAENRRYLSGFTGSAGYLFITATQAHLATDSRYWEQVGQQAADFALAKIEASKSSQLFADLVRAAGATRVGYEAGDLTVATYRELQKALRPDRARAIARLVPTKGLVEGLRAIKDASELALIEQAVALGDAAFAYGVQRLQPGMTEKQAAWEIERYLREHGAEGVAFELIVASGPNGAMPHARPSERLIQAGEPIVIDMGCRVDGYNSDLTRTIILGEPGAKFREVYAIVLQAQLAAEAALRAGPKGKEIDAVARQIIVEAGYGDYFGHGLGHGVGLAVHEEPGLGKLGEKPLQPNMVCTIEPGIYLPGEFGVRIEDMAVVTADGCRVLTKAQK